MGWFSDTEVQTFATTVSLLEPDEDFLKKSIETSIQKGQPITSDMQVNLMNSMGSNLGRYVKYGSKKYYYGLPEGSLNIKTPSTGAVKAVLEYIEGDEITVNYAVFDLANPKYFAEQYLIESRGYDPDTGSISNPPEGSGVTLYSVSFESGSRLKITYKYYEGSSLKYPTEVIDSPMYVSTTSKYYHTRYVTKDETKKWWYYTPDGTYPTLEPSNKTAGGFFPVVPLRHDKQDLTKPDDSERFKTSKRLLKKLSIDIEEIGSSLSEAPDLDAIENAYIIVGVPVNTKSNSGKKYLFSFFDAMYGSSSKNLAEYQRWLNTRNSELPDINSLSITEAGISYDIDIVWTYITKTTHTGNLGKVGTCETDILVKPSLTLDNGASVNGSELHIRKQVTSTTYTELVVVGLKHINLVYPSNPIVDTLQTVKESKDNGNAHNMIMPVHEGLFSQLTMVERTDMAASAINLVLTSYNETELAWYQTGVFKALIFTAAILLTVISIGELAPTLKAAAAIVGSTSLVVGSLVLGTIAIGAYAGATLLVDVGGIEFGLILGLSAAFLSAGLISGPSIVAIQAGLASGVASGYESELEKLQKEMEDFAESSKEAQDLLKAEYDELNLDRVLHSTPILTPLTSVYESPEQYYTTRIHLGNMAHFSIRQIENYVDNQLYLKGTSINRGIIL